MDWDLWGSSYDQDAQESGYCMPSGRQCDFYIGYGYDGIEEDALNEKSCIQVLRILITKADSEIDELEQHLVSLQSQLAWAEYEEWPELCCNALRDKINCLDIAIGSLSNTDENDIEVQLQMHKEPAERVHEIVRALLRNYFQEKDGQLLDTIALDSSSNVTKPAAGLLDENETLSNISSSISIKEETKEASITGKCTGSNFSLKLQENEANNPEIIEPADSTVKNLGEGPVLYLNDHSRNKKRLSSSNVKVMSGEIEEHNCTSMVDDIVLGASSNTERERTDHSKEVKPTKTTGKASSSEATGDAAGHPLGKVDSIVIGNEEARKYKSAATDKRKILNSSSNSKGDGNFQETDKRTNAIVKSISAEALSNANGLNRRKKGSDSDLGALRLAESGNSDLELKLSDFAEKILRKKCVKGLKIAATDKIDALGSSLKAECKRKNLVLKVEVQEASFTKTGHSSTSPSEMQDQRRQEATKLQLMEGKSQAEDIQKVEDATIGKKPILNVSLELQKQKEKRKIESDTPLVREPAFPSIRVLSNTYISKSKSKEKSGDSTNIFILNQSLSRKVTKRLVPPWQSEATGRSFVHDDCKSCVSDTLNKRKRTNFTGTVKIRDSTVHMSLSNLPGNATDSGSKENLQMIKSYSPDDSQAKALALPCAVINLSSLTLNDLRAIAKQQKLRKYHKLRKQVLIELIVDQLG